MKVYNGSLNQKSSHDREIAVVIFGRDAKQQISHMEIIFIQD